MRVRGPVLAAGVVMAVMLTACGGGAAGSTAAPPRPADPAARPVPDPAAGDFKSVRTYGEFDYRAHNYLDNVIVFASPA